MNYVEQTETEMNRRNRIDPSSVPIPAGGPVKLTEITPEQLDALTEAMKRQNPAVVYSAIPRNWLSSQPSTQLTFAGENAPVVKSLAFDDVTPKPGKVTYIPAVDYQALAAFRADVIEELQREITALRSEVALLKVCPPLFAGFEPAAERTAPTKGEVLANALARCDSVTTAYGR